MALPNPAVGIPPNAPSMNTKTSIEEIRDVKLTLKEAVVTGLKAGFLTTQTRVFSKIPLFGKGLAERAEFKKREMFEKEGRDPLTGRKLTKEELEERQLRRKSMGAMGDIRDDVAEIRDILTANFGSGAAAKPTQNPFPIVAPTNTTVPYALEGEEPPVDKLSAEEKEIEKQKADREIQEDIQEKDQVFFTKLFDKYFGKNEGADTKAAASGGGILSSIASAVDFASDLKQLGVGKGISRIGSGIAGIGRKIPGIRNLPGIRTPTPPPLPGIKPPSAPAAGGGFLSRAFGAIKNVGTRAAGMVGSAGSAVYGAAKGAVGSVAKMGLSTVGKTVMGILGPLLTVMFESFNISSIKNDPSLALAEKKKQIGLTIGRMIGSLMGAGVAALGLGPAGPVLTSILDGFGIGPGALGEWLTEKLGPESVYDITSAIPGIGSLIKVPEDNGVSESMKPDGATPSTENIVPPDIGEVVPSPMPLSTPAPAIIPTSASTLGSLQTENMMLKNAPAPQPIIAPTNNNVVTNNNNTSWMSALTTTRTGADFDERSFRLGLAF